MRRTLLICGAYGAVSVTSVVLEVFALLGIQFCQQEDLMGLYWASWTTLQVGSTVAILGILLAAAYQLMPLNAPWVSLGLCSYSSCIITDESNLIGRGLLRSVLPSWSLAALLTLSAVLPRSRRSASFADPCFGRGALSRRCVDGSDPPGRDLMRRTLSTCP
jgi:hypothetical protein